MSMRDYSHTTFEQAKSQGWILDKGYGNEWECICKAHNDSLGMMKSTKRMEVPGGWLYQVTTEGPSGYAEALTFVSES